MWKDLFQTLKHFIKSPGHMGSIAPSSKYLAKTIVNMLPQHGHTLLEIGPGTGAITKALMQLNDYEHIIAIENNRQFVKPLQLKFPELQVIHGNAFDIEHIAQQYDFHQLDAIVSSLPLLMINKHERKLLCQKLLNALPSGKPLLQYSYGSQSPIPLEWLEEFSDHFDVDCQKVLLNVPPARVWRYRLLK